MLTEVNKTKFHRAFEEMFNKGNLAVADELFALDYLNTDAPPGKNRGPESMRGIVAMLRTAFPDLHYAVEEMVAQGDIVMGRVTMSGTHQGPFQGMPATGRTFHQEQMHLVRFRDGKAIEHRAVRDDLGMMRQLGVIQASVHER